ncbi:MAG: PAS domain-containing protein [Candidatus Omnitrophica bacterium]|nr:PAS domain-containing protein [Candidatus Omnitrophota bacterium]
MEGKEEDKKQSAKEQGRAETGTSSNGIIIKQLHDEIEQRKQSEQATQDALEYAENIVATVHQPLLVLDGDLKVVSASKSFYDFFKVLPEETEKQLIYDLGNRQWDIPKLRELLEEILPKTTSFDNFEVGHDFPGIGKRIMLLNAREIYQKSPDRKKLILIAIEDITEAKKLVDGLREKIEQLERSVRMADSKDHTIAGLKGMISDLERRVLRKSG